MGLKAWANTNGTVWTAPSGSIVTSLVDNDNPQGIRPYTMRFEFGDSTYDPTSESWIDGSYWVQVSSSPNVWDFTYVSTSWGASATATSPAPLRGRFQDRGNPVRVLGGNLQGVTTAYYLLSNNTAITEVNTFDTSTLQHLDWLFSNCTVIQTIPLLNLSAAETVLGMCLGCKSLTSIPAIDFSSAYEVSSLFSGCSSLVTVPSLDLSSATTASSFFAQCTSLISAPTIANCGGITNFSAFFSGCTNLTYVPAMDTTSGISFDTMLRSCRSLTNAPSLNTRHGTNFRNMFEGCLSLEEVPLYNTINADDVDYMFRGCKAVTTGALALYTQMSSQLIPPTQHTSTFTQCGMDTVTGAQELAQIPTSWGGTMA